MDRIAFKQRMQNLKSYRENNPGKGYWDWKVQSFAEGGENDPTDDRTDHAVNKPIVPEQIERVIGPADRVTVPQGTRYQDLTFEQKMQLKQSDVLNKDSKGIKIVSPEFDILTGIRSFSQLPRGFFNNKATKNIATNYYRQGEKGLINDAKDTGIVSVKSELSNAGKNNTGRINIARKTFNVPFWSKGTKWYGNKSKEMIVSIGDNGLEWQPITQHGTFTENLVRAGSRRTPIFEGATNNTPSNLFEFYRKYPLIGYRNVTNGYPTVPITGLNTTYEMVDSYANGGEIEDEEKQQQIANAITYALNRGNVDAAKSLMSRGTPNTNFYYPQSGAIDPVFSLYDTPVLGDAMVATDATKYALDGDWTNAGLAMAGLIIPGAIGKGIKKGKKIVRSIPEVTKDRQAAINNVLERIDKANQTKADYTNEQYKIIENVMEDPSYIRRAEEVKKQFGDDYTIPYADMFTAYNIDPSSLPQVDIIDDFTKAGSMRRTEDGNFIYERNPKVNAPNVATHELSHLADLLKSGRTNAEAGNNMFYKMTQDLTKKLGDKRDIYFSNPSEQKAHMNQLRSWLFDNGYINTRDQKITPEYMAKMLSKIDNVEGMEGVRRAAKQFKSVKTYTKWFNSIPLLGAGTISANAYFKRNRDEQRTDTKKI